MREPELEPELGMRRMGEESLSARGRLFFIMPSNWDGMLLVLLLVFVLPFWKV